MARLSELPSSAPADVAEGSSAAALAAEVPADAPADAAADGEEDEEDEDGDGYEVEAILSHEKNRIIKVSWASHASSERTPACRYGAACEQHAIAQTRWPMGLRLPLCFCYCPASLTPCLLQGEIAYLCSWKGYSPEDNSWVTASDAVGMKELTDIYWAKQKKATEIVKHKTSFSGSALKGAGTRGRTSPAAKETPKKTPARAAAAAATASSAINSGKKRGRPPGGSAKNDAAIDEALEARESRKRSRTAAAANLSRNAEDDPEDLEADEDADDSDLVARFGAEEVERRKRIRQAQKYEALADWENVVHHVETVEKLDNGKLVAFVIL
jgi:hypothetical protein